MVLLFIEIEMGLSNCVLFWHGWERATGCIELRACLVLRSAGICFIEISMTCMHSHGVVGGRHSEDRGWGWGRQRAMGSA
jgi:hypothetical protein